MKKQISCIVLAAGLGKRFGGDKLLAEIGGTPLITWALNAVPRDALHQTAVVSKEEQILDLAEQYGFLAVRNDAPEEGISRSIRLGMEALDPCDAILFMVGDQPLLKTERLLQMLEEYQEHPDCIIALSQNGVSGNPVIFPAEYFEELKSLQGDRGGKTVMRKYPSRQRLIEASREELLDVDTPEMLQEIQKNKKLGLHLQPRLTVRLYTSKKALGPGIVRILKLVRELGTLRAAADQMAMSYSNAWSKVRACEEALGISLMQRTVGGKGGGGTKLTPEAENLIAFYEDYCRQLNEEAEKLLLSLSQIYFTEEGIQHGTPD